jgi:hypothetical protein
MEPEVSLPCSQEPAAGPYLESDESSLHLPTLFPYDPVCIIFSFLLLLPPQSFVLIHRPIFVFP